METRQPIHFTLKWLSANGQPERMLNIYAESAAELKAQVQALAAEGLLGKQARQGEQPAQVEQPAPEPKPTALRERLEGAMPNCPKHDVEMEEVSFPRGNKTVTEVQCRESDQDEEKGYCRHFVDSKGQVRRKLTAAELAYQKKRNQAA